MRLIDAYKLEHKMFYAEEKNGGHGWVISLEDITKAPTVDAVKVVRCRDCIFENLSTCPMCYIEQQTLQFLNHDPDFYCAAGERR